MLRKNIASQHISFVLVVASTGAALVGASPAGFISKDGAAQGALVGTFTGLGNGQYDYAPTQAETNANEMGLLFTAATAVPVGLTIYTTAADPSNAASLGLTNLDATVSTRAVESTVAKDATVAKDSTVAKEATLNTKIPTALSFTGANVNANSQVTAAPSDMALDSTVAKDATVAKAAALATVAGYLDTEIADIKAKTDNLPLDPADESLLEAAIATRAAAGDAMTLTAAYDAAKTASQTGDAMTLTAAYDPAKTAAQAGDAMTLTAPAVAALWDEVLEGALSARAFMRIIMSFAAGKSTDDGQEFYDIAGVKKRIDGTVVGSDRTAVVLDGT